MGQRVVTFLNHLDFKIIIIIIIMQIKNGRKKHTRGNHFLVTKRIHVGRNEEKNRERK